jgi:hypothetical protein
MSLDALPEGYKCSLSVRSKKHTCRGGVIVCFNFKKRKALQTPLWFQPHIFLMFRLF